MRVEVATDPAVRTKVSLHPVTDGSGATVYHAEYAGHFSSLKLPWPLAANLTVVLSDGLPNPCRVSIPLTIWPSLRQMLAWWLLIFVGLLGIRWQAAVASRGWAALPELGDDLAFVGGLFLLGVPALATLQLLGWVTAAAAPDEDT